MFRILKLFLLSIFISACTSKSEHSVLTINPEEGFLTINGSSVYYKTMGEGDPIIVVHGGPVMDHSYLLPHFDQLAKDHKLIFYDQRACGKSSLEVDSSKMSMKGFAEDIELIRQGLKLGKVSILGHSWGGLISMHYAINYPQNIQSLILSGSTAPSSQDNSIEQRAMASLFTKEDKDQRNEVIQSEAFKNREPSAIRELLLMSFRKQFVDEKLTDELNLFVPPDYFKRSGLIGLLSNELTDYDLYASLGALEIPTLLIYGEAESSMKISGKKLSTTISGASLVGIDNSGHFPFIENPGQYFGTISTFISASGD